MKDFMRRLVVAYFSGKWKVISKAARREYRAAESYDSEFGASFVVSWISTPLIPLVTFSSTFNGLAHISHFWAFQKL